jgi:hypothetical protein
VKSVWCWIIVLMPLIIYAQRVEVRGTVSNTAGELLPLGNISIAPDSIVTSADVFGNYVVQLSAGQKVLRVSYTGYETISLTTQIFADTIINFSLAERVGQLQTVVIQADKYSNEDIVNSTRSGTQTITQKDIQNIPVFLGEADPIKTIQLLPGIVRGVEGTTDVFVRGGAADQNLVLLDGTPIYNTGHLFGFLSVFNSDVIDKVDITSGGFPAEFGGRLSSVLEVETLAKIPEKTSVSADVGLIASRMKIEQPVIKGKASFWIAGRRSYIDKVVKAVNKEMPYYFYDINGKFIYHPTKSDAVEVSHYDGSDALDFFKDSDNDGKGMLTTFNAANSSQTLKWDHRGIGNWRNSLSVFRTNFNYNIRNVYKEYVLAANSKIVDYGGKFIFSNDSINGTDATFATGVEWIRHGVSPNVVNATGRMAEDFDNGVSAGRTVQEIALFAQHEWTPAPKVRINAGMRGSMAVAKNKMYGYPEPRISIRYSLGKDRALKFNYSRMAQYMHRISNSAVSTPIDIWYPVTDSIRPQTSRQVSIAWQRFLPTRNIFLSIESYYKSMDGLISYKEGTNLLFNRNFAPSLLQGKGKAYGFEFLVRKDAGKFTGWISYTLSWSFRKYDEINNGEWYHARYDRRHNGAIVGQYKISKRCAASLVWEYISGSRFTPVTGQYATIAPTTAGLEVVPMFAEVNSMKLSDTHRLDIGMKFFSKPANKFQWTWSVGLYNAYNRATPIGVVIERSPKDNSIIYSQPGLFGLLPFVSYGCKI